MLFENKTMEKITTDVHGGATSDCVGEVAKDQPTKNIDGQGLKL